jgi:hypothetical protein
VIYIYALFVSMTTGHITGHTESPTNFTTLNECLSALDATPNQNVAVINGEKVHVVRTCVEQDQ